MMLGAYAGRMYGSHQRFAYARTDGQNGRTRTESSITLHIHISRFSTRTRNQQMWMKVWKTRRLMVWLTHERVEPMTPAEASRLVELCASTWTNIKDTTSTREAWFLALAHTNFYDALDAVGSLARERKSIHVSDVVKRAERIRLSLVRSLPPVPNPPVELADDPQAETHWLRVARERQLSQARMERHAIPA